MHDVHTLTRLALPLTMARTRWTLGYHHRLFRRCEWLMLMPTDGWRPQMSQTPAIEADRLAPFPPGPAYDLFSDGGGACEALLR